MVTFRIKRNRLNAFVVVIVCLVALPFIFQLRQGKYEYDDIQLQQSDSSHLRDQESSFMPENAIEKRFEPPSNTKPKVLLLTYLRSGSTFIGDVFKRSPNVFYAFEPIRFLLRFMNDGNGYFTKDGVCSILGGCRKPAFLEESVNIITDIVRNLYMCNGSGLPQIVLQWMSNAPQSRISLQHKDCMNRTSRLIHCYSEIMRDCSLASSYVLKFIRLSSGIVGEIMAKVPDLKVVHLLRDPRGILNSRQKLGYLKNAGFKKASKLLCSEMLADIIETKRLQKIYPGRIKTLLYEDVAENPIDGTKRLYEFTHFKFANDIESYVYNITMAGRPNNYAFGTVRSNSKNVAYAWRESMSFENISIIDTECKKLYDLMGLHTIERPPMLKDFTYFTRTKENDLGDYLM